MDRKFGMIGVMAKLRKQRKMVKSLNNFFKNVSYTHPSTEAFRISNIAQDAIPEADFSGYIAKKINLADRIISFFRPIYFQSEQYIFNKANQNNRLYKSCKDDGYIEYVYEEKDLSALLQKPAATHVIKRQLGIRVSNLGTDLLHPMGFLEIALKKYPLTWQAMWKGIAFAITTLTTSAVGTYFLIKLGNHLIQIWFQ